MRHHLLVSLHLIALLLTADTRSRAQCGAHPIVDTNSGLFRMAVYGDNVFVGFSDYRSGESDIYGQLLSLSGERQWGSEGAPITVLPGYENVQGMAPDGLGGVFILWWQYAELDIFGARVDETGSVVWEGNISSLYGESEEPAIVSDGANGFIMVWLDKYPDWPTGTFNVFGTRIDALGQPVWSPQPYRVFCTAASGQTDPEIMSAGAGDAYALWVDYRAGAADLYVNYIGPEGLHPWGSTGREVCTAVGDQTTPQIAPDGVGGFFVVWTDYRSGVADIYAQRMAFNGTPMWATNGVSVSTAPGEQLRPRVAHDGFGGALLVWEHDGDVYAQRLDPNGVKLWPPVGVPLSVAAEWQSDLDVAADLTGGAYFVWEDPRQTLGGVYAQHVDAGGITSWDLNGAQLCGTTGYNPVIAADGSGGAVVAFDTNESGRYMRLTTTDPTGIGDTPAAPAARLTANVPNPFRGTTEFQFYADGATPIAADVFDVAGRRVATQLFEATGTGWQRIVVSDRDAMGAELSSGVYFVRVRAGETVATRKMVIMR